MKKPSFAVMVNAMKKPDDEMSDDESADDMTGKVQLNAMKALMSALKSGDADKALDVFHDLVDMCGSKEDESEPEEDSEPSDEDESY